MRQGEGMWKKGIKRIQLNWRELGRKAQIRDEQKLLVKGLDPPKGAVR